MGVRFCTGTNDLGLMGVTVSMLDDDAALTGAWCSRWYCGSCLSVGAALDVGTASTFVAASVVVVVVAASVVVIVVVDGGFVVVVVVVVIVGFGVVVVVVGSLTILLCVSIIGCCL